MELKMLSHSTENNEMLWGITITGTPVAPLPLSGFLRAELKGNKPSTLKITQAI